MCRVMRPSEAGFVVQCSRCGPAQQGSVLRPRRGFGYTHRPRRTNLGKDVEGTMLVALTTIPADVQEALKLLFSAGSLAVTLYFWFVRANRERVSVAVHPVSGFEGSLESGGVGFWTGRVFLANRSILPTAVV